MFFCTYTYIAVPSGFLAKGLVPHVALLSLCFKTFDHLLYLVKLLWATAMYPEVNFGGNQLLVDSISV